MNDEIKFKKKIKREIFIQKINFLSLYQKMAKSLLKQTIHIFEWLRRQ